MYRWVSFSVIYVVPFGYFRKWKELVKDGVKKKNVGDGFEGRGKKMESFSFAFVLFD